MTPPPSTPTPIEAPREPWLTQRELAETLKVSRRTIQRLRLPHTRVGGQNRYVLSQCLQALSTGPVAGDNVVPLRPRREETAA